MSPNKRDKNSIKKQISKDLSTSDSVQNSTVKGVKSKKLLSQNSSGECSGFWKVAEYNTGYFFIKEDMGSISIYPIKNNGKCDLSCEFHFEGYVQSHRTCPTCNHIKLFDIDHDSHFCPLCNIWLESTCRDPECEFCPTRPEKPLPVFGVDNGIYNERSGGGWKNYHFIILDQV